MPNDVMWNLLEHAGTQRLIPSLLKRALDFINHEALKCF